MQAVGESQFGLEQSADLDRLECSRTGLNTGLTAENIRRGPDGVLLIL